MTRSLAVALLALALAGCGSASPMPPSGPDKVEADERERIVGERDAAAELDAEGR